MTRDNNNTAIPWLGLSIWFLAALFFLYEFFLRTFIGTIAPQIIPGLNLNPETFALISSGYCIMYGAMQIPVGVLADKFSIKYLLIVAISICALSALWFAHAAGFLGAFLSRFFMGMGSAFAFICLLVITIIWLPKKYLAFFTGIAQFIGTMGPLLAGGPLVLFLTRQHNNWRGVITDISVVGLILAGLILLIYRKKHSKQNKSVYPLTKTNLRKNVELLIKTPRIWYIALYSGAVYASLALIGVVWGTDYLEARGLTQEHAATMVSLAWLGYATSCPLLGLLSDVLKRRKPILIFCAGVGIIVTLSITYLPIKIFWIYGILCFCLGVAASGQNIGFVIMTDSVADDIKATALGFNNAMISVFDAFVPIVVGLFIVLSKANIQHLVPQNFFLGFGIMPLFYLMALLLAWRKI